MYQKWYCSNFVIVLSFLLLDILIMSCEAACEDLHNTEECKGWASNGECRLNPAFMIPNCRKSCKKCQGEDTDSAKRRNLHVGLMKTLFVNISDTMVFKVDFKEIDGLWDKMGDFTYFEFSFVLPPKTILNISNDGSEFIDAMYVDRTKIMPKAEGVMEIAIHDVTKSDGGNYTVAIYVPRKILIMVFMVYVLGGPKLILELEPPFTFYQLYPGEKVPMVTCKTDCFQACYVSWHKVGVNSSSLNSQENVLNLGTFETQKAGVYICVVTQRETYNVGFRGVTFKMKDALKPESTTDTSQVTVVGAVLGVLLFLSMIAIVFLMVWVLRLERLRRKKDEQVVISAANGATLLLTNTNGDGRTYEQLDENTRNQHTYEDVKTGAANIITDASNQSTIYENQST